MDKFLLPSLLSLSGQMSVCVCILRSLSLLCPQTSDELCSSLGLLQVFYLLVLLFKSPFFPYHRDTLGVLFRFQKALKSSFF